MIKPSNLIFLKKYSTDFHDVTIIFTNQNGSPLEVEDKVNLTLLIIDKILLMEMVRYSTEPKTENLLKDMSFYHLEEIFLTNTESNS